MTKVLMPGASDKRACRAIFRVVNRSSETASLRALVHGFDAANQPTDAFLIETRQLLPNQTTERLFSCGSVEFFAFEKLTETPWSGTCINEQGVATPCDTPLQVLSTLPIRDLPTKSRPSAAAGGSGKSGH